MRSTANKLFLVAILLGITSAGEKLPENRNYERERALAAKEQFDHAASINSKNAESVLDYKQRMQKGCGDECRTLEPELDRRYKQQMLAHATHTMLSHIMGVFAKIAELKNAVTKFTYFYAVEAACKSFLFPNKKKLNNNNDIEQFLQNMPELVKTTMCKNILKEIEDAVEGKCNDKLATLLKTYEDLFTEEQAQGILDLANREGNDAYMARLGIG